MKHSICFIDDKIPVNQFFSDTDIITGMVVDYLLKNPKTKWDDSVVRQLCEKLRSESDKWSFSGFTSPAFYENYVIDNVFSPEIIIYDWDYNFGAGSNSSEEYLLRILEKSYTMIFIFSEDDNINEINEIVKKEKFRKYGDRLSVINKGDVESVNSIFLQIEVKESDNFSFRYGHEIIYQSNLIINKVLLDISLLSIEDFISSIGSFNGNKYISTNKDFMEVIMPRYRHVMQNYSPMQELSVKKTREPSIENVRQVWSYRLYDYSMTLDVQMGDVVKDSEDNYFLIVSSDCHLLDFWKKNFGYVAVVPLYLTETDKAKKFVKMNKNDLNMSSLTSNQSSMTILPCLQTNDALKDFVIIPKTITTIEIEKRNEQVKSLTYENFVGYVKVASINDPFKSPMMQFIFDKISGYGCPDYPKDLVKDLDEKIKKMKS